MTISRMPSGLSVHPDIPSVFSPGKE